MRGLRHLVWRLIVICDGLVKQTSMRGWGKGKGCEVDMEREIELEVERAYIWRLNMYICRIRACGIAWSSWVRSLGGLYKLDIGLHGSGKVC